MSTFSGLDGYTTLGTVGVAVIPGLGGNLAFQNFETSADANELQAVMSINGDLSKRVIELGVLPQSQGAFSVSFPEDTDISLFNVLLIKAGDAIVGKAQIA